MGEGEIIHGVSTLTWSVRTLLASYNSLLYCQYMLFGANTQKTLQLLKYNATRLVTPENSTAKFISVSSRIMWYYTLKSNSQDLLLLLN